MEKQNGQIGNAASELLRFLRVRSTVWCRSAMRAPWGFAIKARPLAAFHLVVSGSCELAVDSVAAPLLLEAGDMVVIPSGRAHVARSGGDAKILFLDDILTAHPPQNGHLAYGGGGSLTDLVCGGFEVTDPAAQPLLALLPPVVRVRSRDNASAQIRDAIGLVLRELDTPGLGSESVLVRLTDVLLALVLREAFRSDDGGPPAWKDALIGVAVAAIEEHPERPWSLVELSAVSTLSRSAFSERFRSATGESPMRFLARARLARAAALLRSGGTSVSQIADATGFTSEASFSRAFRRQFGTAPRTYRQSAGNTVTRA